VLASVVRSIANRKLIAGLLLILGVARLASAQTPGLPPLTDWEVAKEFRLDVHATGFRFPTGIAFVPARVGAPTDPLYFVTELHGAIKVVARNGTVSTFAEGFIDLRPASPLPILRGESGLAGICLDPSTGYVFVTYVYQDRGGTLRNGLARFGTRPWAFSSSPSSLTRFDRLFVSDQSAPSHQIGPCQVVGDAVYVAVADGLQGKISQDLGSSLGKILRMTVNGDPYPGNPFAGPADRTIAAYAWAIGLRNVFSLKHVRGHLLAAENGEDLDRFFGLEQGLNYQWAGNTWTLGMNAAMVFTPSVSPVQMDFVAAGDPAMPPAFQERFYVTLGGRTGDFGPGVAGEHSIVAIDYDFDRRRLRAPPLPVVRYRGEGRGSLVALAAGPDGLYFAPLFPGSDGSSPAFRLTHDSGREHPFVIGKNTPPATLVAEKNCLGCHRLGDRGGDRGPSLTDPPLRARLVDRLRSREYLERLARVEGMPGEPFRSFAAARRAIVEAAPEARPRLWLANLLQEPRFDDPEALMPNPRLTESEAWRLADFLLEASRHPKPPRSFWKQPPPARYRYVASAFLIGLILPLGVRLAIQSWRHRRGP
jgi:hypothetical protein